MNSRSCFSILLSFLLLGTAACGSDSGPRGDGGGAVDGGSPDGGAQDAGSGNECATTFANCTTFTDHTDGGTPTVGFGGGLGNNYSPKCLRIKAGQSITFSGAFTSHPLDQACGPVDVITATDTGSTASFTFSATGRYGYFCTVHGTSTGTGMAGAINVVP
jgi:plastocyanin